MQNYIINHSQGSTRVTGTAEDAVNAALRITCGIDYATAVETVESTGRAIWNYGFAGIEIVRIDNEPAR